MRWIVFFLSNILLIFCFPLEDVNLCKRKPYLIFCKEQNVGFFESRQQYPEITDNSERHFHKNPDQTPLERPLLSMKERMGEIEEDAAAARRAFTRNGNKQPPIDLSRPNAEDVAREMGELQRDDPTTTTTTESSEVDERTSSSSSPIKQIKHNFLFSRHKRAFFSPQPQEPLLRPPILHAPSPSTPTPTPTHTKNKNNKRQQDWVYLDDTDDLDYIQYRKRRARLLRRLNELDADQLHYHRTPHYPRDTYESYGSSYSSYYPSNYYPSYYPSYGYPSSNYGSNPGYMGGYGYRQPFTFGIGSGLNIGLPYGYGVGVGSGLGVTVG